MVKERYDYSSLLNILEYAFHNYKIDQNGNVINKFNVVEHNKRVIAYVRFGYLYYQAYGFNDNAFTDYLAFNSLMNNCLNEYAIYSDIGTGNILYFPYQSIANYIFDDDRKKILIDFWNCERPINDKIKSL